MSEESKDDGAWVPLTPPKPAPARYGANSTSEGLNQVNFGREFEVSGGACSGGEHEIVRNCDGSVSKIGAIDGAKSGREVGFMVDGKPEGVIVGISENGLTEESNVQKNQTSKKRSRKAVDLNKKPKKRMKMKRHRPKVYDETKPLKKPSTPKPKTPKRPKNKKKEVPKTVANPSKGVDGKAVVDLRNSSCRQKLDFEEQNCVVGDQNIPKICDVIQIEPVVEPKQQSSSRFGPNLIVYRRVFKPNECLKNSRKTGPNCPKVYKKKRTMRKRVTMVNKYITIVGSIPPPRKQRRTAVDEPVDLCHVEKDIKRRPRSFRRRKKPSNAWMSMGPTLGLAWKSNFKKKRSKRFSCCPDLSLFVSDISKLQLSEDFLLKASTIRTRDIGVHKFSACVESEDEVIQHLETTKSSSEKEEIPKDYVVSCNNSSTEKEEIAQDCVLSCNESIEKVLAEDDFMVGVETYPYVNGESSEAEVKCTEEIGSFSADLVGPCDDEEENVSCDDEEENVSDNEDDDALVEALVDYTSQRMESLNINDPNNEIVVRDQNANGAVVQKIVVTDQNANGAIVPSEGKFDPLKKRKVWPKVDLDPETMRVWNMLMENGEGEEDTEKEDESKAKYWKEQRELFRGRVDSFIARMHQVQGDRQFSPWKGSVVDSVVGVFLTQNVSDHLSSSAFMSLVARFPPPPVSDHNDCDCTSDCIHDTQQVIISEPPSDKPEELSMTEIYPNYPSPGSTNQVSSCDKSEELLMTEIYPNYPSPGPTNQVPPCDKSEELLMTETYPNYPSPGPTNQVPPSDKFEELSMTGNCPNCPSPGPTNQVPPSDKSEELPMTAGNCPSPGPTNEEPPSDKSEELPMNGNCPNCPSPSPTNQVPSSEKSEELSMMENCPSPGPTNQVEVDQENIIRTCSQTESTPGKEKGKVKEKQETPINWDDLRKQTLNGKPRKRTSCNIDAVDWEAVRQAPVEELAKAIKDRGQQNLLAARIKDFLDRIVNDHGSIDLEWLRDVPPDKAKEYLLSINGLGLKSVECVRLLSLHHHAFPVDTNVGRILVRLGWVPLQPLPEDVQIHLLNQYPMLDTIQKYIWPRICEYSQRDLYELHCQLIACGKALCTKRRPNCNACPMRGECRHFASAFASSKLKLEGRRAKNATEEHSAASSAQDSNMNTSQPMLSYPDGDISLDGNDSRNFEPIVEFPPSPEPSRTPEILERDIEDLFNDDEPEIPTIELNREEFIRNVLSLIGEESVSSTALVALRPELASIPRPKLKDVKRLRTVHHVYELPRSHPLLSGFNRLETGDPSPYLFAIWAAGETPYSSQESGNTCNSEESITQECCSGESSQQNQKSEIVHGTILIPCRTANRGSFPLNGTYFQVNEVFADHQSSHHPVAVETRLLWNLRRRSLYCGTSTTSICRDMTLNELQYMFWRGFICIRGVDSKSRRPRPLAKRFHLCKTRQIDEE